MRFFKRGPHLATLSCAEQTHHEAEANQRSSMLVIKRMCCVRWLRFQTGIGDSKRKTFQTGSRVWPRHVTRPRSNRRTSLNQLPLPLTSINTSPQNGCVSITHYLLGVHRLAICTAEELSLQPAWTPPISSSELRQRPHPKQFGRTKRGPGTLRQQHFEET